MWASAASASVAEKEKSDSRPGVSYEEDSVLVEIFITDTSKFNTWSIEKQSISLCTELAAAWNVRFRL
jgi:hypothetical protein